MPLKCPACGLVNTDTASRCDCGEDLAAVAALAEQLAADHAPQPGTMRTCMRCGSDRILPNVPLLDHFDVNITKQAEVNVHAAPQAWFFKGTAVGQVFLSICGACGYAELRVSNARELWEKHQQAQGQ